ncbi:unnamed protein product [Phytophthora lilii]|uniref:Unnamed protein product n=1 Tax=Phytophthora lilii TaxID=2077276 RepID=A0A9W6UDA7_9STRA|nr:unnamed protein product [Phytophthora lilii]
MSGNKKSGHLVDVEQLGVFTSAETQAQTHRNEEKGVAKSVLLKFQYRRLNVWWYVVVQQEEIEQLEQQVKTLQAQVEQLQKSAAKKNSAKLSELEQDVLETGFIRQAVLQQQASLVNVQSALSTPFPIRSSQMLDSKRPAKNSAALQVGSALKSSIQQNNRMYQLFGTK